MSIEIQYIFLSTFGVSQWIYIENSSSPYFGKMSFFQSIRIGIVNHTLLGALYFYFFQRKKELKNHEGKRLIKNYSDRIELSDLEKIEIYIGHIIRDKIEIYIDGKTIKLWFENSGQSALFAKELQEVFNEKVVVVQ